MNPKNLLWTEKYRPQTLQDLIVPNRIKEKLQSGVYSNFLFYSSPGRGKTTAAKILAKGHPTLYINASLETGVETVRTKITEFASGSSLLEGKTQTKVVILDEIDGVSEQFFKGFRATIEQFNKTTRFISTCNHFNKIPDSIQSRFECINFDFDPTEEEEVKKMYYRRVYDILKNEGITIKKDALLELVNRKFPDMRSIINLLQGYWGEGKTDIDLKDLQRFTGAFLPLFELVVSKPDPIENYKRVLSEWGTDGLVSDAIVALGTDFIDYLLNEHPTKSHKIGEICYETAKHAFEVKFSLDPTITLLSLVFKLQNLLA